MAILTVKEWLNHEEEAYYLKELKGRVDFAYEALMGAIDNEKAKKNVVGIAVGPKGKSYYQYRDESHI